MAPSWERPPSTPIPFDEHKTKRLEARKKLERLGVDPGIQDTVLYLNELGFCTSESCEGHTDHGNPAPRVALAAPNEPRWRFQGQQTTFETVAAKYRVTVDEVLEYSAPKYEVPPGGFIHDEAREDMLFKVLIEGREQMTKKEETEKSQRY